MAFAPYRANVPIGQTADGKPVFASKEFWDHLTRDLYVRVGGATAPTNSELVVDLHDDAGIEELKEDIYRFRNEVGSLPPQVPALAPEPAEAERIASLEARVAELTKQIEDLKQGLVVL